MSKIRCGVTITAWLALLTGAFALDGAPGMHDPSTVIQADGKFYVYATGNGLPAFVSDDGWTWRRAGSVMQAVAGGRPGPDPKASRRPPQCKFRKSSRHGVPSSIGQAQRPVLVLGFRDQARRHCCIDPPTQVIG